MLARLSKGNGHLIMNDVSDDGEIKGVEQPEEDNYYASRLPKGYLSVSQVTQYLKCGEAYRRRYVLGQPTKHTSASAQGRSVHKAAEVLHISMINNRAISEEEMVQVYSDQHDVEMKDAVLLDDDKDDKSLKDIGVSLTRRYRHFAVVGGVDANSKTVEPIKPIAAERSFKVHLPVIDAPAIPFMGVIDLEEEHSIADLKTKAKPASQLEADNSLQLSLYAYVTGKPSVRLDQLVKPTKTLPVRYFRTESIRTRTETLHAVDVVADVAADIAEGRFRRTNPDNWWCTEKWCEYWNDCRGRKR